MKRILIWAVVGIVAVIGVVVSQVLERTNTHDYASNRTAAPTPDSLTLHRSDLAQYLRYQFNVEAADEDDRLVIRAGLCQVANRSSIEGIDIAAAEATLVIASQPWFQGFVEAEGDKLRGLRQANDLSLQELRAEFLRDLVAHESFRAEFPGYIERAVRERGLASGEVVWLD